MKKFILMIVVVIGIVSVLGLNRSEAKGTYGKDVDSFCLDSDPYSGNCLLCHDASGDTKVKTSTMAEFKSGNLCYFCPDDSNCTGSSCADNDLDGYFATAGCGTSVDCNDNDANINPGLAEDCSDTKDNDCNGLIDSQDPACTGSSCADNDLDGYFATAGCGTPVDCNDTDANMSPGLAEDCSDTKDNDCNGFIDAQDPACGTIVCTDADLDGFSIEGEPCGPIDCKDDDPDTYPGAPDICADGIDQDCSGKDRTKGKGCKTPSEGKGKTCSDGLDNDNDGLTDCADDGCYRNRACR